MLLLMLVAVQLFSASSWALAARRSKTRFPAVGQPYRAGLVTRRVPTKDFRSSHPPFQALPGAPISEYRNQRVCNEEGGISKTSHVISLEVFSRCLSATVGDLGSEDFDKLVVGSALGRVRTAAASRKQMPHAAKRGPPSTATLSDRLLPFLCTNAEVFR